MSGWSAAMFRPRGGSGKLMAAGLLACGLLSSAPHDARADDGDTSKAAPRTALQIGDASVVLVAANDRIYAFVDRIEDNAPIQDAELAIQSADGNQLEMTRATGGLFIAPFNRAGHIRDAFMVSLRSSVSTGETPAEIAYDDLPEAAGGDVKSLFGAKLGIALVSGGIGGIVSALFMMWLRGGRRRAAARAVGTVQAA